MRKQKTTSAAGKKPGAKKTKESQEPAGGKKKPRTPKLPKGGREPDGVVTRQGSAVPAPGPRVAEEPEPVAPTEAAGPSGLDPVPTERGEALGEGASEAGAGRPEKRERDPRLPPPGTVLQRKDRQGQVRCECVVLEEGVSYAGTVYRSLSAAAVAAAKALGGRGTSANGYNFWGLSKPSRARVEADPLPRLSKRWDAYVLHLETVLEKVQAGDRRAALLGAVERQARILTNLHAEARECVSVNAVAS